ncbi:MAG: ribonuclease Z [Crenarchaeota archaeon]|nr:ribonuclease Z [Thermoproteota archaeon]
MKRAKAVVLGSSAATPKPKRGLPAHYFEFEGTGVLMDVGEGTQFQLMKANIGFSKIKAVVVTHMHGDHVLGLPGLLETMSMASRKEELLLLGPPGLYELVSTAFKLTHFAPSYPIRVIEAESGHEVSLRNVKIKLFPVNHGVTAFGVRIETVHKRKVKVEELEREGLPKRFWSALQSGRDVEWNGRVFKHEDYTYESEGIKVVYSGDTAPCERLVEEAKGADLLIHEATFTEEMREEAHERGHSTAKDAALAALRAGVRMLLLTHFSGRYEDLSKHLEEARRVFPNSYLGEDLTKVLVMKE